MTHRIRTIFVLLATLGLAALVCPAMLSGEELEDHAQKTFPVHAGGALTFASEYGTVTVKSGDTQTATIQLDRKVDASSAEEAKKILDDLDIEASQQGDTIHYEAKFKTGWQPRDQEGDQEHRRTVCRNHRCLTYADNLEQMDFTITVPKQFNLDLATQSGHMQIGDIDGKLRAETWGGSISMGKIGGPVNAQTSGGAINLDSADGSVELHTAGGHIHCGVVKGDAEAKTAGGAITIEKVSGKATAHTAGGSIELEAGDAVQAKTAGGSIRVRITGQPQSDSSFETAGGGVTIELPAEIRASIDAHGSRYAGRISSDFPVAMESSSAGELRGTINGGGPAIVIRDGAGAIHIRKTTM
jgi:DUF4097 and DUF4098 domain-containing protein YvlB